MTAANMTTEPAESHAPSAGSAAPIVFSYARKSPYKKGVIEGKGSTLGVDNQHDANADYIRRAIHPDAVIVRFTDESKSAYLDKPRPAWEDMLRRTASGEPDAVVGWHTDRMCRRVEATGRLWTLIENVGTVELHTTMAGHVTDPMQLYFESIMAENESRQRSRRMRLKHDGLGKAGGFPGGQRRYGYTAEMDTLIPAEAEVIREAVARVLNGESLSSIAASFNERAIPTARGYVLNEDGNPTPVRYMWHQTSVRAMLVSPHIAALRMHKDNETAAQWPEVIDVSTYRAVVRKLTAPDRLCKKAPGRRYLLTGIAKCGKCGAALRGTAIKSLGTTVYRCRECKGVQRSMPDVDAEARAHVIARLEEIDASGALVSGDASREAANLTAERDGLAGQRAELAALMASGALSPADYAAGVAAFTTREADIAARLDVLTDEAAAPNRALEGATGPDAARVWDEWTNDTTGAGLTRQRAIAALLLDVTVLPLPTKGRVRFDPETVRIEYRDVG